MPPHSNALKQLLDRSEHEIVALEARLLETTDDAERSSVIDKLADLHLTCEDLKAILTGQDPPPNNSPSVR
jgi:hypothetical protein